MTDAEPAVVSDEERRARRFPGLLGMRIVERRHGYCRAEMDIEERRLRPQLIMGGAP
jgi:acyl-coenzyme A thioesterase PaaI-like protein